MALSVEDREVADPLPDSTPEPPPGTSRSRVVLVIGALLALAGALLVARAAASGLTQPKYRLGGIALLVVGGVLILAPEVLWRDIKQGVRTALRRDERVHMLALVVIVALGVGIRAALVSQAMRYDETVTFLGFVARPLGDSLADYAIPNNHFFNTLLMHMAWRAFGDSPGVLRLPAMLAGAALVPAVYAAGRTMYDRNVGLLAAALAVPSGALVEYSTNARGYSLVTLATVVLIPLGAYAIRRGALGAWVLWAAVAAFGLWSVPTMVYGLAIVVVWLALLTFFDMPADRRRFTALAAEHALLATLAITYVLYQPAFGDAGFGYRDASVSPDLPGKIWHAFSTGYGPFWWVIVAGIPLGVVLHGRVARLRAPLWGAIAIVVPLTLVASDRVPPFVRTWLFLLPLLLLVASAGLVGAARLLAERVRVPRRAALAGALVPVVVAGVGVAALNASDTYQDDDPPVKGIPAEVAWLKPRLHKGDGIALGRYASAQFQFYALRAGMNPNIQVASMALQGPAPGRPTWTAIVDEWPPPMRDAEIAFPFLKGSRLVKRVTHGAIYLSPTPPPPKRPTAKRTGGHAAHGG